MPISAYIILAGAAVPIYAWLAFARTPRGRR